MKVGDCSLKILKYLKIFLAILSKNKKQRLVKIAVSA